MKVPAIAGTLFLYCYLYLLTPIYSYKIFSHEANMVDNNAGRYPNWMQ